MKVTCLNNACRLAAAGLLTLSGVLTVCASDYPTTVLGSGSGPLGYWRFNESAASPPLNIVSNLGSLGARGNGYIAGSATVTKGATGKIGTGVNLGNSGAVADLTAKIDVPYTPVLNPSVFTIEFWVQPAALGGDATGASPISNFNPNGFGGGNRSGWLFYLSNTGRWQFRLGLTSGYAGILSATGGTAVIGTWQHVVGTYDGSTMTLYVNGVSVGTLAVDAVATGWKPNTQMALRLGGTPLTGGQSDGPAISATGISGNRGLNGNLDEVALYPAALSATTVKAHFDAATTNIAGYGSQILASSPVGYWNMEDPAVVPPDPSTFPIASNIGSLGNAADGTNMWGVLAAQAGSTNAGFGAGNNAAFFNGESGYIGLKPAPGLQNLSGNITLMAWVKPMVKDFFRDIIAQGWDANFVENFFRISRSDPQPYFFDGGGTSTNFYEVGTTDGSTFNDSALYPIPAGDIGNWVFLAGTYDGTSWNLYRNGVLAASFDSDNGVSALPDRWSIGSRSDPTDDEGALFGGYIDEPAIFGTALTAGQINAIYNSAQVAPVVTRAPVAPASPGAPVGTVFSGLSASLDVWIEGSPTLTYLWTSNGISTGVTTTNITFANLAAGVKTISVIGSNPYGSVTSSITFSVVDSKPLVLQQPVAITRFTGFPFSFSVGAGGSPPISYQWKTNNIDIAGATASSYSGIASAATAQNYSCLLSNVNGTSNSVSVALTVLPIPSGYAAAIMTGSTPAPLAYWRLGEGSGTVAHDYVGGHDGLYSGATLGQPGYSALDADTAATFGGVNSHVGSINGSTLNLSGHTNFSIEFWANGPAGQSDESTIVSKGIGSSGTTATEQFAVDVSGGNYRFFTRGGGNSLYDANASTGPDGTWQHVVGVYDDAGGQVYIYVNGELQGSHATRPAGVRDSTDPVSIGGKRLGNDPNYDGFFAGTIDEVSFYNYALDSATVLAHYAAAYGGSLSPAISKQPVSTTNYVSLPASLVVGAYGTVPLSYQWQKIGSGDIAGATKSIFTISALALTDTGDYFCHITNSVNPATNSATVHIQVLSPPATAPNIPGLVVHMPFNGDLTDVTGRGNNGAGMHTTATTTNAASPGTPAGNPDFNFLTIDPVLGSAALHYASDYGPVQANPVGLGTTTTNSFYVTLGIRPDLQFGASVDFTFAFWIRLPLNFIGGDLPFITDVVGSTGGTGWVFAPAYGFGNASGSNPNPAPVNAGGWAYSVYDSAGTGVRIYGDVGSINDGLWHHLVFVIARGAGNSLVYLDGVAAHSSKIAGTRAGAAANIDPSPATPASIGQDPTGTYGEGGAADIDDLGVWRKALTPLQAASIYMAAISNHVSFGDLTPSIQVIPGNQIKVTWHNGTLQQADNVGGPYTPVGVSPPSYTTSATSKKFYRVQQ